MLKYQNKIFEWEFEICNRNKIKIAHRQNEWNSTKLDEIFVHKCFSCGILFKTLGPCTIIQTLAILFIILFTPPKVYVHFHSKFIQYGLLVGLRLKIGPFWAQDASPLHFVCYHSSKMTTIGAKFCQTVKWYSKQAWLKVETANESEMRHLCSSKLPVTFLMSL
jgi:hypothetical protein